MTNHRAYSLLEWKALDDDKRILEGIATTPAPDRMGDVVETDGIEFKLPLPLLWQHDAKLPIGEVLDAKVTKNSIRIKAKIAPPGVDEDVDKVWRKIKAGLARGLSIGFRSLEETFDKTLNGFRFVRSEWMELSVVTIPANAEATILTVKSMDTGLRAVCGAGADRVVRLTTYPLPGVPGHSTTSSTMTIQEQITAFETKRAASQARMDALVSKSAEEGRTFDDTETQEYDGLMAEAKAVDEHLVRLRAHEKSVIAKATRITTEATATTEKAAETRSGGSPVQVKSMAPKGILPARMAIAMYKGGNVPDMAAMVAKRMWPDNPEVEMVIRTGVDAGDTTTSGWASQLVPAAQRAMDEFLELLRAATIVGRIPGLRRVPFNVTVPVQSGGGTYGWVGEALGKPVTSATFTSVTLRWAKAAGIIVITEELAKFSSPSAEQIIRDEMVQGLTRFFDAQFVGSGAEVTNVSPAGILNGISAVTATGTTAATFRTDMNNMLNNFTANNVDPSGIVLLMSATQAIALSLMITDLGVPLFPSISVNGGSILGMPVIVSEQVGTKIIALNARDILLAEDNGIRVDVSREASVEMETTPAIGEQSPITALTNLKSLWQNNLVGFRVERYITWKRGRDSAVEYINANAYVP